MQCGDQFSRISFHFLKWRSMGPQKLATIIGHKFKFSQYYSTKSLKFLQKNIICFLNFQNFIIYKLIFVSSFISKNQLKSLKTGHHIAKILLFRTHHLWNSTTELILLTIVWSLKHQNTQHMYLYFQQGKCPPSKQA